MSFTERQMCQTREAGLEKQECNMKQRKQKEASRRGKHMPLSFKEKLCERSSKPGRKRQEIFLQAYFSSKLYTWVPASDL